MVDKKQFIYFFLIFFNFFFSKVYLLQLPPISIQFVKNKEKLNNSIR